MTTTHAFAGKSMSEGEFKLFRDFLHDASGLHFNEMKRIRLESRVSRRMHRLGLTRFRDYYGRLEADGEELYSLMDEITVNETRFFRNLPHFEALMQVCLPQFLKRQKVGIYFWSAACATGEEPYSLAMLLREFEATHHVRLITQVLATDISQRVLAHAVDGRYSTQRRFSEMPQHYQKYFRREGEDWVIAPAVRKLIQFKRMNLKTMAPHGEYEVIFLRNVIMYFSDEERIKILDKVHRHLRDDGYLFLGDAETIGTYSDKFVLQRIGRALCYRKAG